MKRKEWIKTGMISVAVAMAIGGVCASKADVDDETQIVCLEIVPTPVPQYQQYTFVPNHYDWDSKTIDAVASIYWAETGYGSAAAAQKLALTQLIWNRVEYYNEYGDKYAGTIYEVCRQKGEFNRGKVSDKNRNLAIENLDMVRSQAEGTYCGITVPRDAVKMAWDESTGEMYFLNVSNKEVWRCKE